MSQPRLAGTFLESRLDQMRRAGIIGPEEHVQVRDGPGLGLMRPTTVHSQHAILEEEASSSSSYERSDVAIATSQDNPQEHIKQSTSGAALPEDTVERSSNLDTSKDGLSEIELSKSISDAWPWSESHTSEVNPTGASVPVHAPEEPQVPLTEGQAMPMASHTLPFVRTEPVLHDGIIPYRPAGIAGLERIQHMEQLAREAMRSDVSFGTVTLPWSDHSTDASNSLQQQQLSMEGPPQQQMAPGSTHAAATHFGQMVQFQEELPAQRSPWWKQLFCCVKK